MFVTYKDDEKVWKTPQNLYRSSLTNMILWFPDLVECALRQSLGDTASLDQKSRSSQRIVDEATEATEKRRCLMSWRPGGQRVAVDAKHKTYADSRSEADICQTFNYTMNSFKPSGRRDSVRWYRG